MSRDATLRHFDDAASGYYQRNYTLPRSRHERGLALRRELCVGLLDETCDLVLDLGCGPGALAVPLAQAGRAVVAMDRAPRMVEEARRLIEERVPGARSSYCVGDATALPFVSGRFDAVVTTGMLEYIRDVSAVLGEIHRILRPGGILIATVSLPRRLERTVTRYVGPLAMRIKHGAATEPSDVPYHRPFAADDFDRLVEQAGLRIDARLYSYFAPFPFDALYPPLVTALDRVAGSVLQRLPAACRAAKTYIIKATRP